MWPLLFASRFLFVSLSLMIQGPVLTFGQHNVGFVHPIATDTFPPEKHPSAAGTGQQQQPAEEDLTSPSSEPVVVLQQASPPQFQVPVTLPFVMQRPQMKPSAKRPPSYLRPIIMIDPIMQDDSQQPIRQTKPWFLPAEEDLSSAPSPKGVAVTLPFRNKPTSYLRPAIMTDEDVNEAKPMEDEQPIRSTKPFYYFPTGNVAVTLPFDLRQETKNPGKPSSYLRPSVVTGADDAKPQQTPEADYADSFDQQAPAEEDLTSPIRAPNAMTIPFVEQPVKVTKPTSYLRPWFVDDSPVRGTRPSMAVQQDDSVQQLEAGRPVAPWAVYRGTPVVIRPSYQAARPFIYADQPVFVKNGYYDDVQQQPAGVWPSGPLIATLLPAEVQQPLKPMKQLRPWIVENYYNQPQTARKTVNQEQPVRQTKPWFVPAISQQSAIGPVRIMSENVPTRYQLVKPLIALPEEVYYRRPIKQQRPWTSAVPSIQSSIAGTGQAEARVPFLGNWANGTPGKTHIVGNNTLVYTKQNLLQTGTSTVYTSTVFTATTTIVNAYCFSSANPGGALVDPSPWCSFRRKRSAATEEEEQSAMLSMEGETIQPSQVQKILMTVMPSLSDCNKEASIPIASSMVGPSMADNARSNGGENKVEGRFLNVITQGRPTTTVTVTGLTVVTEISITGTTAVTFLGGTCVPRCLQNLPTCAV
ncbi:hypothetical protein GHT06_011046 [Daphnia sinensis]|uniref:Uncharacterized protein n=1 Tax=Daphnia sinensis TaxID=1820382 RepID=A0AAD5PXZ7_9CRUS|nr:hypothetical protein GHT06_011046 [Daphnia sinensis]